MGKSFRKRIAIVDDHPIMRRGLVQTIESEPTYKVVAQFDRAEKMIKELELLTPDLILADISLKGMNGLELIKHLIARDKNIKILIVSRHDEDIYAERVVRAGAKGYVMKLEAGKVLLKAARKILKGGIYVSDGVNERLLKGVSKGKHQTPIQSLSDRELEVFELTGSGNSTREIASQLHLSIKTIESYRARIKSKLNLDNATELMLHAVKWVENEQSIS